MIDLKGECRWSALTHGQEFTDVWNGRQSIKTHFAEAAI
jgi:hypothetical protein